MEFRRGLVKGEKITPPKVITVFKCPCGRYLPSDEGLDNHLHVCSKLQTDVLSTNDGDGDTDRLSEEIPNNGVIMVKFSSPRVLLKRLAVTKSKGKDNAEIKEDGQRYAEENDLEWKIELPVSDPGESDEDFDPDAAVKRTNRQVSMKSARFTKGPSKYLADDRYIHTCNVCPTKFKSDKDFDWHMLHIHGEASKNHEIISCPICGRMINKRLVFHSHLKSHENAEAVEEAFDLWNKWPKQKRSTPSRMMFSCKYCLIPHTSQYSFLTHMEREHPQKGRFCKYLCQHCGTSEFDSIKHYILHIRTTHSEEYYGKTIKWASSNPLKQFGRPKGQCDICKRMLDVYYIRAHKEKVHFNKSKQKTMLQDDNNGYNCPMPDCYSKFKNRSLLKNHFILHLENNPFVCTFPGCNVRCDAQCHLNRHIKLHTSKPIPCPKCGVSYSRIDKLKNHVCCFDKSKLKLDEDGNLRPVNSFSRLKRIQPEGENIPSCTHPDTESNKRVKNNTQADIENNDNVDTTNVNAEVRYNKGIKYNKINVNAIFISDPVFLKACKENPGFRELIFGTGMETGKGKRLAKRSFKCGKCFTSFNERKALEKHSIICKNNDEEGNIKVENISDNESAVEGFASKMHTTGINTEKLGCPICGASFRNKQLLEDHIDSNHQSKETFRCIICDIVFSSNETKNHHMKTHHKNHKYNMPFKCSSCFRSFSTKRGLCQHQEAGNCDNKTKCSKCGKILVNSSTLARHWFLIHGIKLKSTNKFIPKKKTIKKHKKPAEHRTPTKVVRNDDSVNTGANANHSYSTRSSKRRVVNTSSELDDYSIVKIETEPEVSIDACDFNIDSDIMVSLPQHFIKTETL